MVGYSKHLIYVCSIAMHNVFKKYYFSENITKYFFSEFLKHEFNVFGAKRAFKMHPTQF
jgi:hypothetical protein